MTVTGRLRAPHEARNRGSAVWPVVRRGRSREP
jgi:hypothetical protein